MDERTKMKVLIAALALLASLLSPVIRPGAEPAQAQPLTEERRAALEELYRSARREGEVILHFESPAEQFQPLIEGFQWKFPGIKVTAFAARADSIPPRIIRESKAGEVTLDVAMGTLLHIAPLLERDLLVSFDYSRTSDVDPDSVSEEGRFVSLYDDPAVIAFNTDILSRDDIPRTLEDLLRPAWEGHKIAVAPSDLTWGHLLPLWNQDREKVVSFLRRLGKQDLLFAVDSFGAASRVARGESPLGFTHALLVASFVNKGAPLALCPITPTYNVSHGGYLPKVSQHPNAAKLLMSYFSSRRAAPIWARVGYGKASPCNAGPLAKLMCESRIKHYNVRTVEQAKALEEIGETAIKTLHLLPDRSVK